MFLNPLVFGILLPAIVSFVVLVVAWRPWRRNDTVPSGSWAAALAVGLGCIVGQIGVTGWPLFPPPKSTDWFPYLVLAALPVVLLDAVRSCPVLVRWCLRTLLILGALVSLLRTKLQNDWSINESVAWLAILGLAGFVLWATLDQFAEHGTGISFSLSLIALAAGTSCVALFSGTALLTLLSACLAATLTVGLVMSWWKAAPSLMRGAVPVVMMLLLSLWLTGYFYGEVPAASAVLLVLTPMAACHAGTTIGRQLKSWRATLFSMLVALLPIALALFLAWKAFPADETDPYGPGSIPSAESIDG